MAEPGLPTHGPSSLLIMVLQKGPEKHNGDMPREERNEDDNDDSDEGPVKQRTKDAANKLDAKSVRVRRDRQKEKRVTLALSRFSNLGHYLEYNSLNNQLDQLNGWLDRLERKNADIHQQLIDLLQKSKSTREEFQRMVEDSDNQDEQQERPQGEQAQEQNSQ